MPTLVTIHAVCDQAGCTTSVDRDVTSRESHPELVVDTIKDTLPAGWRVELDTETGLSTWFCPTHA